MTTVLITLILITTVQCAPDFSERARNFSIELFYYTQTETDGHVIISPFGIWSLMTALTFGATGNSRTELIRAFVLPKNPAIISEGYTQLTERVLGPKTDGVMLTSKNFLFLDNSVTIRPDFQARITGDFGAKIQSLDFQNSDTAANIANNIIQISGASVSNVLSSDDFANSRMILTNVITFKGLWSTPFNKSDTLVEPFYDENKNEVGKVNMMYLQAPMAYSNIKKINSVVLELPYGLDKKYCMLIILPYSKIKVRDVYKHLAMVSFPSIFAKLQSDIDTFGLENINVKLPRFKISTNVVLNKPLNSMGVYDIFDSVRADFDQMTSKPIFVSSIVHKADIEVIESGTEASASTNSDFKDRVLTTNIFANRPFMYFVMERSTATVIFSGIYSKPSIY